MCCKILDNSNCDCDAKVCKINLHNSISMKSIYFDLKSNFLKVTRTKNFQT